MKSAQERHAQAQRVEDKIQELDKDLRFLHWEISKIEKMIRTALQQVKVVNLSASRWGRTFRTRTATIPRTRHCHL